jgi:hypothetical protein
MIVGGINLIQSARALRKGIVAMIFGSDVMITFKMERCNT